MYILRRDIQIEPKRKEKKIWIFSVFSWPIASDYDDFRSVKLQQMEALQKAQ